MKENIHSPKLIRFSLRQDWLPVQLRGGTIDVAYLAGIESHKNWKEDLEEWAVDWNLRDLLDGAFDRLTEDFMVRILDKDGVVFLDSLPDFHRKKLDQDRGA